MASLLLSASAQSCTREPFHTFPSLVEMVCTCVCVCVRARMLDVDEEVFYKVLHILIETLIILIIT